MFAHPLSPAPLCVVKYLNSGFEADVALRRARAAQGCTANAHGGFVPPGDPEGSNPLPVLLVTMSLPELSKRSRPDMLERIGAVRLFILRGIK